jgi:hypothetical protein
MAVGADTLAATVDSVTQVSVATATHVSAGTVCRSTEDLASVGRS